jgi:hypothetical protein
VRVSVSRVVGEKNKSDRYSNMGPRRKINFKELPKQLTTAGSSSGAAKPVRYWMYILFTRPPDLGPYPGILAELVASRWQPWPRPRPIWQSSLFPGRMLPTILALTSSPYPFLAFLRVSLPDPTLTRLVVRARCARWYGFVPVLRILGLHLNCVPVQIAFSSPQGCMEF